MTATDKTISDAAEIWLKRCRLDGLEKATLRSYEGHVRHHIEPKIGSLLLKDFTAADVREFLDLMLEASTRAMTKKALTSLRAILSEAQSRGLIPHNVARDVKLRNSRRHDPDRRIPSKAEIKLLIDKAPERHKPLIITAILTGMRASELRGLTWDDVDLERRVIRIRQRADRFNKISVPKSRAGRREIPLAPLVVETLRTWRANCPTGELNLVFPNGAGNVESHWNIYNRVFKPLMIECGIVDGQGKPRFGIHSLRHAAASLFIEQGWPAKKVQTMLGHSSVTMTFDVYGHLFHDPANDVELMAKMERDLLAA